MKCKYLKNNSCNFELPQLPVWVIRAISSPLQRHLIHIDRKLGTHPDCENCECYEAVGA